MKKRIAALFLAFCAALLTGCADRRTPVTTAPEDELVIFTTTASPALEILTEPETDAPTEVITEETTALTEAETDPETEAETAPPTAPPTEAPTTVPEDDPDVPSVEKDGSYTTPEDVAAYIHTFGTLPGNFITKKQAQKLGWVSSEGNLWDVAPGKSIGGDYFGNREGLLPDGDYRECDVNYEGGFRQAERLIYGTDGSVYYTNDHYKTFTQLY